MSKVLTTKFEEKGFTLLETLVSIFVVITGIVGVHATLVKTTNQTNYVSSKFIAVYLAQEGVEIVRNIRDTNWVKDNNWDIGISVSVPEERGWEADYSDTSLTHAYDGDFLMIDGNDFYNYTSGSVTNFKRKIVISDKKNLDATAPPDYEKMTVTVTVYWGDESVEVKEHLYDWR